MTVTSAPETRHLMVLPLYFLSLVYPDVIFFRLLLLSRAGRRFVYAYLGVFLAAFLFTKHSCQIISLSNLAASHTAPAHRRVSAAADTPCSSEQRSPRARPWSSMSHRLPCVRGRGGGRTERSAPLLRSYSDSAPLSAPRRPGGDG